MICGARRRWLALRRVDGIARTFIPFARVGHFRRTPRLSHAFGSEAIVFCRTGDLQSVYWTIEFPETACMSAAAQGRPPFRADHVGSLLRPAALRQAFRRHATREISDAEFGKLHDQCIRDVLAMQEEVGLKVVSDGEFRRGSYWGRFVERTDGFAIKPASFKFRNDAGHEVEFTAPYATKKIKRLQPLALDEFLFLRGATKLTGKITLPAPSTMHFYRCDDYADRAAYSDVDSFFADLAKVFQQEIAELAKAGCRYVQLDEVAVALLCDPAIRDEIKRSGSDPDALVDLYIKSINDAVAKCPAEVAIGVHMCRGNFKGHYLGAGGYESVDEASRHIDLDRLAIGPQCGFASTVAGNPVTEDDERRKLALVVEAARQFWP